MILLVWNTHLALMTPLRAGKILWERQGTSLENISSCKVQGCNGLFWEVDKDCCALIDSFVPRDGEVGNL